MSLSPARLPRRWGARGVASGCAVLVCAAMSAPVHADGDPSRQQAAAVTPARGKALSARAASLAVPRFAVRTLAGFGEIPIYTWPAAGSDALNHAGLPQPFTRVVIVVHGIRRDADKYLANLQKALGASTEGVLLVAPRFSSTADIRREGLAPDVLAWSKGDWSDGDLADGPAPIASFDVLDAMLTALSDRLQFPALKQIVVAGFSAGGQMVQRYAAVGAVFSAVEQRGIQLRWVVGDPGSVVYFDDVRPTAAGGFAPFRAAGCPDFNRWKYGFEAPPPYVAGRSPSLMADDYAGRDVVYLLGGADTNALHPLLDKSCAGEAQGPHRYGRLAHYIAYLKEREPTRLAHRWGIAPGAGHSDAQVFQSACGRAALFDAPGCSLTPARDAVPPAIR